MKKVSSYSAEKEIEERRLAARPYLENGTPHQDIADRFGVKKRTVRLWKTRLTRYGEAGLHASVPFHRPSRLSTAQKEELIQILLDGPLASGFDTELWTSARVAEVIETRFGVTCSVKYLPQLLHALGCSPQTPHRQAAERNEEQIQGWVRTVWPEVKKKPAERMQN